MRIEVVNTIKYKGTYHYPGAVLDITEKEIWSALERDGIVKATTKTKELSPVEKLQEVSGVTKKIAEELVAGGIDTVDKLSGEDVKSLEKLESISKKVAAQIYKAFDVS